MSGVSLRGVSVVLGGHAVLEGLTLDVEPGGWVGLIGPNGAGKTTALRAVAGLVPHRGEIRVGPVTIDGRGRRSPARIAALVPQRPSIPEGMSVTDYLLLGRTPHIPYLGVEGRRDIEVVGEVLERLELEQFANRILGSLSGGELQRAVVGRALAQEASVLLLDKPASALDVGHQQQVLELVDRIRREAGLTVLTAMHDLTLAAQFADRLLFLSAGRTVAFGPPRGVLSESAIREHYGATVRIVEDGGRLFVVPVRAGTRVDL